MRKIMPGEWPATSGRSSPCSATHPSRHRVVSCRQTGPLGDRGSIIPGGLYFLDDGSWTIPLEASAGRVSFVLAEIGIYDCKRTRQS